MDFALYPQEGGYPRLWRFVAPGVLPEGVLSTLDEKQNLLTIDKELFDMLPELDRHIVLRTHRAVVATNLFV